MRYECVSTGKSKFCDEVETDKKCTERRETRGEEKRGRRGDTSALEWGKKSKLQAEKAARKKHKERERGFSLNGWVRKKVNSHPLLKQST